jgi:hypothetical protein
MLAQHKHALAARKAAEAEARTERLATDFACYLSQEFKGSRHVLRVMLWLGSLLKAIEAIADGNMLPFRKRQFMFTYRGRRFRVRLNHHADARGGIDIVEVLPGRGMPDGDVAVRETSLSEAVDILRTLKNRLDRYCDA